MIEFAYFQSNQRNIIIRRLKRGEKGINMSVLHSMHLEQMNF